MALQQGQQALKVLLENIPKELQQFNNFVMWKATQLEGSDTLTKVPYNAKTGRKAKVTDPNSWSTFEQASKSYNRGKYSGIGLVIEESMNLVAIDIDNMSDPVTDERVKPLLDVTYCELSPSGKGIRAFIFGDVGAQYQPSFNNRDNGYEAYTSKRYVTLTGQQVSSVKVIATDTDLINNIFAQYGEKFTPNKDYEGLTLDSIKRTETPRSEVFRRIKKANPEKKERILALYEHGPDVMSEYGFQSQSDADYSLISDLLFYADNDYVTVNEIMTKSALYRDKYDSPRRFILDGSITASYGFNSIIKLAIEYNNKKTYSEYVRENRASASDEFEAITEGWGDMLERHNETGKVLSTRKNIRIILDNDPKLKSAYRFNEFANTREATASTFWRTGKEFSLSWTDLDDAKLRNYLSEVYNIEAPSKIYDVLEDSFSDRLYNPVKDYLEAVEWDGMPRANSLFIDFLVAPDTEYTKRVTELSLVGCVRRIYEKGCKHETMAVLYGSQGLGKSTILKKLGGEFFSDQKIDINSKDSIIGLQGSWLVELAELSALTKKEVEDVKHFLSVQVDEIRLPFDKRKTVLPRQCVFFGSTNTKDFLKDDKNRRFYPISTDKEKATKNVFTELTPEYVQQCWSEILYYYQELGVKNYLDPVADKHIIKEAEDTQQAHKFDNGLAGKFEEYLRNPIDQTSIFSDSGDKYHSKVTVRSIWRDCLKQTMREPRPSEIREINSALRSLPFLKEQTVRLKGYGRSQGYRVDPSCYIEVEDDK